MKSPTCENSKVKSHQINMNRQTNGGLLSDDESQEDGTFKTLIVDVISKLGRKYKELLISRDDSKRLNQEYIERWRN